MELYLDVTWRVMKKIRVLFFLMAILFSFLPHLVFGQDQWVPDQLIVHFIQHVWTEPSTKNPQGKNIYDVSELTQIDPEIAEALKKYGVYQIKMLPNVDDMLKSLSHLRTKEQMQKIIPGLEMLRYRYLFYLRDPQQLDKLKTILDQNYLVKNTFYNAYLYPNVVPNDTDYALQWGLPYMDAENAWNTTTDASNVIVGIVDGGFQDTHVDLNANVIGTDDVIDGGSPLSGIAACDDHGTHVAGTIGAEGNNAQGVSGVFWTGNLFLVRMGQASGTTCGTTDADNTLAIASAVANGANIISRSFSYSAVLDADVVANPTVLFVNAAGNGGADSVGDDLDTDGTTITLSAEPNFIFVANITSAGALSASSNFGGATVHLAAPGTTILSTVPTDSYDNKSGTSMATPHVSGVAALAWSQCSALTASEIKDILLNTVTVDATNLGGNVITDGYVNASDAVNEAVSQCDKDGDGYNAGEDDCDDTDASIHPGAAEICDSIDNDCDGTVDEGCDADGDGYTTAGGDCDDSNAAAYPGAPETCSDGIDQDCDGADLDCNDVDNDGDGQTENEGDCDDTNLTVYTGAPELCDGIDNDCDAVIDPDCDDDGDGLTNSQEWALGTDPKDSDSDDDSLSDGDEVNTYHTNPLDRDTDHDNLEDNKEILMGTDPNDTDSDDDSLTDGSEVYTYHTDPTDADTDGDGLSDGIEVNTHGTDPNDSDSDDDRLSDGDEVNVHGTDPLKTDSDGDVLADGDEVLDYGTDPADEDTDDDALLDGEEILTYTTDPLDEDTDDDGWSDGAEVYASFSKDPLKFDNLVATNSHHDFMNQGLGGVIAYYPDGRFYPFASDGNQFVDNGLWGLGIGDETAVPLVGDFDGDHKDDVAALYPDTGEVSVALSDGTDFIDDGLWISGFTSDSLKQRIGDFNGDGLDDVIVMDAAGNWEVALSTGASFRSAGTWLTSFGLGDDDVVLVGDFDDDGQDDLLDFVADAGTTTVALSQTTSFETPDTWAVSFATGSSRWFVGDFDGNGQDDLVAYHDNGTFEVAVSLGDAFDDWGTVGSGFPVDTTQMAVGDFNGDCLIDVVGLTVIAEFPDWETATWTVFESNGINFVDSGNWRLTEDASYGSDHCKETDDNSPRGPNRRPFFDGSHPFQSHHPQGPGKELIKEILAWLSATKS